MASIDKNEISLSILSVRLLLINSPVNNFLNFSKGNHGITKSVSVQKNFQSLALARQQHSKTFCKSPMGSLGTHLPKVLMPFYAVIPGYVRHNLTIRSFL